MARKTAARGRRSEHAVAEIPLSLDEGGRLSSAGQGAATARRVARQTPALVATGAKAGANLFLTLPLRPSRVMVRAEMKIVTEEHLPDNEALLVQLLFGNEGAVVIYRDAQGGAVAVVPGGKVARFPSWPVGTTVAIGLSVDNAPAHFQRAGPPTVVIGLRTFAAVGAMKVVVDDVAIYWERK